VTNRAEGVAVTIVGKGTHVSIDLSLLGFANRAFGICHGEAGRCIVRFLEGLVYGIDKGEGIEKTPAIPTAASAATAESSLSVGFDRERARRRRRPAKDRIRR
jgi:hypothetical protein